MVWLRFTDIFCDILRSNFLEESRNSFISTESSLSNSHVHYAHIINSSWCYISRVTVPSQHQALLGPSTSHGHIPENALSQSKGYLLFTIVSNQVSMMNYKHTSHGVGLPAKRQVVVFLPGLIRGLLYLRFVLYVRLGHIADLFELRSDSFGQLCPASGLQLKVI